MSNPETILQDTIRLALGRQARNVRLFRNPSGLFWAGKLIKRVGEDVHLAFARPMQAGLSPGAGDLIGITTIICTPEMVGKPIGVFTSGEVKTPTGVVEPAQQTWCDFVNAAGGFAGVIRSEQDALRLVRAA